MKIFRYCHGRGKGVDIPYQSQETNEIVKNRHSIRDRVFNIQVTINLRFLCVGAERSRLHTLALSSNHSILLLFRLDFAKETLSSYS